MFWYENVAGGVCRDVCNHISLNSLRASTAWTEELRKELRDCMKDSISKLTLQVKDPKVVKLRWMPDVL
jgi:hypothetical protein